MSSNEYDFDEARDEDQTEKDYLLDSYDDDEVLDGDRSLSECLEDWVRNMSDDEEEEKDDGGHEAGVQSTVQDETQSAFSDTFSDSDDWDADAEIAKGRAGTADMAARMNVQVEAAEDSTDGGNNDTPLDADGATTELISETLIEESFEAQTTPEKFTVDSYKPWILHAQIDGALLPIGGDGGDDLYRRDVRHWRTGCRDFSGYTSDDPRSYGKPSLLSDNGTFTRLQNQLNHERWQRHQIANEFKVIEGELDADRELIGMLKHAVESREKELEKGRANVQRLEKISVQWKTAFEHQRPLADAERERQALIEAGYEFSQDADTQTSPVETYAQESIEKIPSTDAVMQTDNDDLVAEDLAALASERDDLHADKSNLSDQVRRLAALLEASKHWIEAREWELKGSTKKARQDTGGTPDPAVDAPRSHIYLSSPVSTTTSDDSKLPSDSAMLDWPQHWTEREQEIRRSVSWRRARDIAAAELHSWTRQMWASAGSNLALVV